MVLHHKEILSYVLDVNFFTGCFRYVVYGQTITPLHVFLLVTLQFSPTYLLISYNCYRQHCECFSMNRFYDIEFDVHLFSDIIFEHNFRPPPPVFLPYLTMASRLKFSMGSWDPLFKGSSCCCCCTHSLSKSSTQKCIFRQRRRRRRWD